MRKRTTKGRSHWDGAGQLMANVLPDWLLLDQAHRKSRWSQHSIAQLHEEIFDSVVPEHQDGTI